MPVHIECDKCLGTLIMEDWQHRKDGVILCDECYKKEHEVKYELTGNDASIMESAKKE